MAPAPRQRRSRRFFLRGLKTLLPTLITLTLIVWVWNFLWENLGRHLIWVLQYVQFQLDEPDTRQWGKVYRYWNTPESAYTEPAWWVPVVGVSLAVLMIYFVGLLVGNLIGRTFWRIGESLVIKIPVIRAIYPAAKQITDFLLREKSTQFQESRVVACRPHANDIWSVGLVTGSGLKPLDTIAGEELVTVFIPSSPTAFSGYVVMVPRSRVVELPLNVEEAMRLLISGGVLTPPDKLQVMEYAKG
jgi:uncharacterized membrane protein